MYDVELEHQGRMLSLGIDAFEGVLQCDAALRAAVLVQG